MVALGVDVGDDETHCCLGKLVGWMGVSGWTTHLVGGLGGIGWMVVEG